MPPELAVFRSLHHCLPRDRWVTLTRAHFRCDIYGPQHGNRQKLSEATRYAFACSSCLTILQEASGQALLNAGAVKLHALSLLLVVLQPRDMLAKQVRKARTDESRGHECRFTVIHVLVQWSA